MQLIGTQSLSRCGGSLNPQSTIRRQRLVDTLFVALQTTEQAPQATQLLKSITMAHFKAFSPQTDKTFAKRPFLTNFFARLKCQPSKCSMYSCGENYRLPRTRTKMDFSQKFRRMN
jgi:hypothetical protein